MKELDPKEVEKLVLNGEAPTIIDVREDEEVAEGMIPNAVHIPLGTIESRLSELDKGKEYIMVCRSGRRSERACSILEEKGFAVTNMTGGMLNWTGPTE